LAIGGIAPSKMNGSFPVDSHAGRLRIGPQKLPDDLAVSALVGIGVVGYFKLPKAQKPESAKTG
jgi:hypothetical protein